MNMQNSNMGIKRQNDGTLLTVEDNGLFLFNLYLIYLIYINIKKGYYNNNIVIYIAYSNIYSFSLHYIYFYKII